MISTGSRAQQSKTSFMMCPLASLRVPVTVVSISFHDAQGPGSESTVFRKLALSRYEE